MSWIVGQLSWSFFSQAHQLRLNWVQLTLKLGLGEKSGENRGTLLLMLVDCMNSNDDPSAKIKKRVNEDRI